MIEREDKLPLLLAGLAASAAGVGLGVYVMLHHRRGKSAASLPDGGKTLTAPMPGTLLAVRVRPGKRVRRGEVLAILDSMKMENEIYAPKDGVVDEVFVCEGDAVRTGAPLLTLR